MSSSRILVAVEAVPPVDGIGAAIWALREGFLEYNRRFFGGALGACRIVIAPLPVADVCGEYRPGTTPGFPSRIGISPQAAKHSAGFVLDVLLHEMVHGWQHEIAEDMEDAVRGHGVLFARECNRIGVLLGLPPVAVTGDRSLPGCGRWPLCVRPAGYYVAGSGARG
jgi:hypothetical protein